MVGDARRFEEMVAVADGDLPAPADPLSLLVPEAEGKPASRGLEALSPKATICSCENVTKAQILAAIGEGIDSAGTASLDQLKAATRAGTGCGGCVTTLSELLRAELAARGLKTSERLCEHFDLSRRELFQLVCSERIGSFGELLARHGRGIGCEVCKPAAASILAVAKGGHILDGDGAAIQDTNDHFLANLQRDGTYSVVPRVPGGEITPEKLIVLGEVARDFGLYVKITGGQRIDLLGARVESLPAIWARLVDAGFESGHAYGKAVRTVKSCVGTNWCRFGVGDSTALAVDLELRYRGLRAPHKVKLGVSGCARECAEAQSKDVGVIATERGWNLYVGGNGGTRPRHAELLASDLDTPELVRLVDRFLMLYIRSADRLQRTASWIESLEGGVDYLKKVIVEDAVGVCLELEEQMQQAFASYQCEWRQTLSDPRRLARFKTFVNSEAPDPDIVFVSERGLPRPAREWEKVTLAGRRP